MLSLGALLVCLTAGNATPAPAADKIHIGYLTLVSHAPTFIAQAKGYFAAQGLDADLVSFQAAEPMAVAIASGDVDFGVTAITGGLISLADKGVVKVIGGALTEEPAVEGQKILVAKAAFDQGLKTPAQLKGHSFGITTAGSSFQYMAHKIAEKEGFADADLRLQPLHNIPAIVASLKTGQIDAWTIVPNIAAPLVKSGAVFEIGKIADYIPHYQVTTVFTSTANVRKRADVVKRFMAAYAKGVADYNAALVDKTMPAGEATDIVKMINKYVYNDQPFDKADPAIRASAMRISQGARLNLENIKDQLDWFKAEKMVPADVTMDKLVDATFAKTD
jgi:NitT/TauT family transport system substrate-binding protein